MFYITQYLYAISVPISANMNKSIAIILNSKLLCCIIRITSQIYPKQKSPESFLSWLFSSYIFSYLYSFFLSYRYFRYIAPADTTTLSAITIINSADDGLLSLFPSNVVITRLINSPEILPSTNIP